MNKEIRYDFLWGHIVEMVKNDTTMTLLPNIRIEREKNGLDTINFSIRIDKSIFENLAKSDDDE